MKTLCVLGIVAGLAALAGGWIYQCIEPGIGFWPGDDGGQFPCLTSPAPATVVVGSTPVGTGPVRVTLRWKGTNDLDLRVIDPQGSAIDFTRRSSDSGGTLDVDANREAPLVSDPVENIYWAQTAPHGRYVVLVQFFAEHCNDEQTPFQVEWHVAGTGKRRCTGVFTRDEIRAAPREVARFEYRPTMMASLRSLAFWLAVLAAGPWVALVALAMGVVLLVPVAAYRFGRFPHLRHLVAAVTGCLGGGFAAGAAAQMLFVLVLLPLLGTEGTDLPRLIGWTALGGLLGRAVGGSVKGMSRGRAFVAGAMGGLIGAWLMYERDWDLTGRLEAAVAIGALVGLSVQILHSALVSAPDPEDEEIGAGTKRASERTTGKKVRPRIAKPSLLPRPSRVISARGDFQLSDALNWLGSLTAALTRGAKADR